MAARRRSESDDEVRANIEPEWLPVFEWQRRAIKAQPHASRTEVFQRWCEEHTDEIATWRAARGEAGSRAQVRQLQRDEAQAAADHLGKPGGVACLTCPGREARCVLPQHAQGAARVAVVGGAPSRADVDEGKPLAGGPGRFLGRGLATIGLRRQDCHWTLAVLCDVRDPREQPRAARACSARLAAELAEVGAPVVVPLDRDALRVTAELPKRPALLKWRGSITRTKRGLVLPMLDPRWVLRAPKWGPTLEIDVARLGRVLEGAWVPPEMQPGRALIIARGRETLTAALALLTPGAAVALDVETVGLGPTSTALVCFVLSDGPTTIVVPWSKGLNGLEGWWWDPAAVAAEVSATLATRTTITHNGPAFDHLVVERYGIKIGAWEDTLLAHHAFASHLPKGLSHVVSQYLDTGPWKQWEHNADVEQMWRYCGLDGLYTILAWHAMRELVGC